MSTAPRGRRPAGSDTRAAILAAARTAFAEQGFTGTTIRGVARAAEVDPALVHHYFGSKDSLYLVALEVPVDPREQLAPVLQGPPEGAGDRLLGVFLSVWEDPGTRPALLGLLRSALEPGGERAFREGFLGMILAPLGRALELDQPERRTALVASQVAGLLVTRYLLELEPLASMPAEQVRATYAPVLQHYLTGSLPGPPAPGEG